MKSVAKEDEVQRFPVIEGFVAVVDNVNGGRHRPHNRQEAKYNGECRGIVLIIPRRRRRRRRERTMRKVWVLPRKGGDEVEDGKPMKGFVPGWRRRRRVRPRRGKRHGRRRRRGGRGGRGGRRGRRPNKGRRSLDL